MVVNRIYAFVATANGLSLRKIGERQGTNLSFNEFLPEAATFPRSVDTVKRRRDVPLISAVAILLRYSFLPVSLSLSLSRRNQEAIAP
ncbi:unnamed protein product [Linum trigynum]|uniref:Uncharacterized protein n=1 Tax=Linum trigynum TaxID=586398 RepID=A0AAV2CWX4_9ROSI